jgi:hypothetical protein
MRGRAGAKPGLLTCRYCGPSARLFGVLTGAPTAASAVLLFATLLALFPVPARASSPIRGTALGAYAGGGVLLADSPYFPTKAQPWWSAGFALEVPLGGPWGLGFSLGFHQSGASNAAAGFLYRGFYGLEAGAYILSRSLQAGTEGGPMLLGGMALGASASFEAYSMTELLFFYPSFLFEPYLELHLPRLGRHTFGLGLPYRVHFRKDLTISASLGLNLRWRWYPKGKGVKK